MGRLPSTSRPHFTASRLCKMRPLALPLAVSYLHNEMIEMPVEDHAHMFRAQFLALAHCPGPRSIKPPMMSSSPSRFSLSSTSPSNLSFSSSLSSSASLRFLYFPSRSCSINNNIHNNNNNNNNNNKRIDKTCAQEG